MSIHSKEIHVLTNTKAKFLIALVAGLLAIATPSSLLWAEDVEIPDKSLEKVIREILKKKQIEKETITDEDLRTIYFLHADRRDIGNLSGLEHCLNLAEVSLAENKIEDVSPLSACTNIQLLDLSKNWIKDITPLETLVKLQYLQLEDNKVSEIGAVAKLTAMNSLYLSRNDIADISPVKDLPKIWSLYLRGNRVSDIGPVQGLKWLSSLDLKDNEVKDLAPLESLTELRWTFLQGNQIEDLAALVRMAEKDAGGDVRFAPFWNLYVGDNPLNDESGGTHLDALKKVGVRVKMREND